MKMDIEQLQIHLLNDSLILNQIAGSCDLQTFIRLSHTCKSFREFLLQQYPKIFRELLPYRKREKLLGLREFSRKGLKIFVEYFAEGKSTDWNFAMCHAIKGRQKDLVMYFIEEKGANSWSQGLIASAKYGNLELAKFFVGKGADCFNTAMEKAVNRDQQEMILFLISQGAVNHSFYAMDAKIAKRNLLISEIEQGKFESVIINFNNSIQKIKKLEAKKEAIEKRISDIIDSEESFPGETHSLHIKKIVVNRKIEEERSRKNFYQACLVRENLYTPLYR